MKELTEEEIQQFCNAHGITIEKYYELLNANDNLDWLLPDIIDTAHNTWNNVVDSTIEKHFQEQKTIK